MTDDESGEEVEYTTRGDWITQDDFPVETYRIVAPDGSYDSDAVPDLDPDGLRDLYRWMCVERIFDERMVNLQRRGQLGTFASGWGQEASIVGSGYALDEDDWVFGMGREAGALFIHGVPLRDMILFWRGIEDAGRHLAEHNCMIAISIGSHLPLVAGVAWGMDLSGSDAVATAYFGDGATSTGASHEAINFAGVLGVPALFFCQNNQYAISTPFEKQTRAGSIAQRAVGYGIDGIRVDGNDLLAVYDAVSRARARAGEGTPVIVESVTYRMAAHTTSDDPTRYRTEEETESWEDRDPLHRYREFLRTEGVWERIDEDAIEQEVNDEFDAALDAADAFEERPVAEIFEYLYEELPPSLRRQLDSFEAFLAEHPDALDHIERRPRG